MKGEIHFLFKLFFFSLELVWFIIFSSFSVVFAICFPFHLLDCFLLIRSSQFSVFFLSPVLINLFYFQDNLQSAQISSTMCYFSGPLDRVLYISRIPWTSSSDTAKSFVHSKLWLHSPQAFISPLTLKTVKHWKGWV